MLLTRCALVGCRHVRQMEICVRRMKEESARRGQLIEQQIVVLDLKVARVLLKAGSCLTCTGCRRAQGLSYAPSSTGMAIFKETIRIDQVRPVVFFCFKLRPSYLCPYQAYYPERLGSLFIVNAPWLVALLSPPILVQRVDLAGFSSRCGP